MRKIISLLKQKKNKYKIFDCGEYEYCVVCRTKLNIKSSMDIKERAFYIEGVGQLCSRCYYCIYGL